MGDARTHNNRFYEHNPIEPNICGVLLLCKYYSVTTVGLMKAGRSVVIYHVGEMGNFVFD